MIQWRFASAKQHSADVRECLYILEGKKRSSQTFLCSCPQLLVPECCSGEWESRRLVSALAQDGCSSSVVHGIVPAGEVTLRKTSTFVEARHVTCACCSPQYKVYAIPEEEFSMEYVEPKVLCVSTHGRFTQDRFVNQSQFVVVVVFLFFFKVIVINKLQSGQF